MSGRKKRAKDRRKLGVNLLSVIIAAKKVAANPKLEVEELGDFSIAVLEEIVGTSLTQAQIDWSDIDWEAILAFILKILPLLLFIL